VLRSFQVPPETQWVVYGILMILVVYFLPQGIVPAVRDWWLARRTSGGEAVPGEGSTEVASR
jgi:branched-chain amino acid transport system permease protein